jgi:hypothetical protein
VKKFPKEIFLNYADDIGAFILSEVLDDVEFDEGVKEIRAARYQLVEEVIVERKTTVRPLRLRERKGE